MEERTPWLKRLDADEKSAAEGLPDLCRPAAWALESAFRDAVNEDEESDGDH